MLFPLLYAVLRFALFFWHPVLRVKGLENYDENECYIMTCNHASSADPFWIVFALKTNTLKKLPRIMAKAQLMRIPVINKILEWIGVFGVERGEADITSLKIALKTLNERKSLLIFPQGTRCRNGDRLPGKTGVAMMATRTNTKILPIYLTENKRPFAPIDCVIGEPYYMEHEGKRANASELHRLTDEMMDRIYALGDML